MKRSALALLLLLSFPLTAQMVGGDGKTTMPISSSGITGIVSSVSGNLIAVINGAITIDAAGAKFHNRKGEASIADVKPGVQIIATITNPEASTPKAGNIIILDAPAGTLNGPVQSVDIAGSSFTMFGVRVKVTASTRIYSYAMRGEGTKTIADIKPGDTLAVELSVSGSTLVAETIQILPPMPNFSVTGTVKSIGATMWVITTGDNRDVIVTVNAETRIDPSLKVGDSVQVVGIADAAGNVVALSIYALKPRPTPPPAGVKLSGTVKSIGTTSWVITTRGEDITVTVGPNTKIEPGIKVGDAVVVVGERDASGNLVALAITKSAARGRGTRE